MTDIIFIFESRADMTMKTNTKRQSHCISCGIRLSAITATGDIRWQPSHVDDKGLYCVNCYNAKKPTKDKKAPRSSK